MSRRMTLPAAEELLRTTEAARAAAAPSDRLRALPSGGGVRQSSGRRRQDGERRPSGRQRHDEKITVYVSAEELIDLEQARLTLRGEHGMVVDRGRIVREALAVVLADLDANGEASILVRRLRGR
jgi:hypothetical protein